MSGASIRLAVVDPAAELGDGVRVGPFAVIGPRVEIGEGTEIGAARLRSTARRRSAARTGSIPTPAIGMATRRTSSSPASETRLEIGDRNQLREFVTVHRGTAKGGGVTRIGSDNLFMVYTHVAHDCQVGSRTIFANDATLAGHVEVDDDAIVGAFSAVHQFCRVGRHAYIGGFSVITQDALPFVKTVGHQAGLLRR